VGQVAGREVTTVEGFADQRTSRGCSAPSIAHGATQCGICTPGMLMAATDLLRRDPNPDEAAILDALGGVLCRCTGYRKIIDGRARVRREVEMPPAPAAGARSAAAPRRSTAPRRSRARSASAPTASPPTRSGCASCARRTRARASPSAISTRCRPRFPGLVRILTAADVPSTATASTPT
jgi:aldehyde oxidoreductase